MTEIYRLWGPPGTGKTAYLMRRAGRLLASGVLEPRHLGLYSFTRAAAREGAARLVEQLGLDAEDLEHIGTLHSQAYRLLGVDREHKVGPKQLRPFFEALGIGYRGVRSRGSEDLFDEQDDEERTEGAFCLTYWDWHRSRLLPARDEADLGQGLAEWHGLGHELPGDDYWATLAMLKAFVPAYEALKRDAGLWDFAGLLVEVLARQACPDIRVLMVDEAQDLSPLQYRVVRLWASRARIFWLAGDPYQAIYNFQGAEPRLFIDHPGRLIRLEQSHRLPADMVDYAYGVLLDGGEVEPFTWIGRETSIPIGYRSAALFRTCWQARERAEELLQTGTPFRAWRGGLDPIGTEAARTALAALELGRTRATTLGDLERISRLIPTGAGELGWLKRGAKVGLKRAIGTHGSGFPIRLDQVVDWGFRPRLAEKLAEGEPWPAFEKVDGRLREYYRTVADDHGPEALVEDPDLTLSTMHGAKGREWDTVNFSADWATRPYFARQTDRMGEHCVAYVGLSRARGRLVVERPPRRRLFPLPAWSDER